MSRVRKLIAAAASFAFLVQVETAFPQSADPSREAHRALGEGRYLDAVDWARDAAFGSGAPDRGSAVFSTWLQIHPFIGGTLDPLAIEPGPPTEPLDPARAERYRRADVRDAVREIAARAAGTRLVILNEAHHSPRDRAFALEVARALRPLGYSILAAEAFTNYVDADEGRRALAALAADGFPRRRTGHYVADPMFGDFVRQALAMGYRPAAYEATGSDHSGGWPERIARREQAQAEALAEILRRDPQVRLLVYVGFSHAAEAPVASAEGEDEWMASRLKRISGIDPLTIDQTVIDETSARRRAYRDLAAPRLGRRPGILFLGGAPMVEGQYAGAVDLQVVHPPLRLVRGRPDWLLRIGRRPVAIPRRLLSATGRRLVQAFAANEPADAIPLDQIVVEAGRPPPPLMLPRGAVRWQVQDPATRR
ncbi:MAG TPA: hypothetical protein VF702_00455 [Allosphingosinicella sp.]|jgi:hypothetical protein